MRRVRHGIILFFLCLCSFFINNGYLNTDILESRNIVTAREMVYDGNWLIPTMNGAIRLQKPPLPTWLAAAVEIISPDNIAAQRRMAATAATFLVIMLYLIALELTSDRKYAMIVALLICTSYNIILMGRTATWDIYCHSFMTGGIFFLIKALREENRSKWQFVISGLFIGLSFMSKGPVSLFSLLVPFIIAYMITYKSSLKGKWSGIVLLIGVALIIGGWWYLYIYIENPGELLKTVGKESQNWTNYNTRPWYYYYGFPLEAGIWFILCLTTLFAGYWRKLVSKPKEYTFALLWMVMVVITLSLIPEKKTRYLLPMLIPAALAMGHIFRYWTECVSHKSTFKRWIYFVNTIPLSLVSFAIPVLVYIFMFTEGALYKCDISAPVFIAIIIFFIVLGLFLVVNSCIKPNPMRFISGIAVMFVFIMIFLMPSVSGIINNPDFNGLDKTLKIPELANVQFYHDSAKELRIEQVYDAHRVIRPLDIKDSAAVFDALPCVILTHGMVDTLIPTSITENLNLKHIGQYDGNRRRKGTRFYKDTHIWDVTLLNLK
ncbi:MAG: DUF6427 family protein [Rikenellaceae bacterium]|nr:DUF6427 family protein [Rikenellaceae bacterium]